ncbi:MAG: hypothetical protein ABSH22_17790 [Tepidisphaeraceae bacterium]
MRIGAMLNVRACDREVDLERMLLETSRQASGNFRLFILAVTWLAKYGEFAAKHRLARLIYHELGAEHRAALGLMLDLAREKGINNSHRFNQAMIACGRATDQRPLLDIDRRSDFFVRMARKNASAASLKWGRWVGDFELKEDAIRPASWIIEHNPSMRWRGDFKGDLRASVLAELEANAQSGASKSELARACGATRAATTKALESLKLSGRIRYSRQRNRLVVQQSERHAA